MTTINSCVAGPFHIPAATFSSLPRSISNACRALGDRLLAFPSLNEAYARTHQSSSTEPFCERALRELGVRIDVSTEDLGRIPTSGPLIVVANHPFGGLDGLVLTALLQRVRPDVRLLANHLLQRIPEMHDTCLFVDPFGGPVAVSRNRGATRAALRWVESGGALGVFPAGEVSHFTLRRGCITDPQWSESTARLVKRTRATVVPVFFEGRNSPLFQAAGLLHPRLRTALLPREMLSHRNQGVQGRIGSPIPFSRMSRFASTDGEHGIPEYGEAAQLTEYLRVRTYILKGRGGDSADKAPHKTGTGASAAMSLLVDPVASSLLAAEIAALPSARRLSGSGHLGVYYGTAEELPNVLREIGRLREFTFRLVGEGTGREIDFDHFDSHYLHLFVWTAQEQQIIGAYRMGQTDVLLKQFGAAGLYTSTLFQFKPRLLAQLTPALELGRSFIIPECQRDYAPLLLLWKGIGRFVAMNPQYRRLFGAVSISDDFQSMTKQLLMAFLKVNSFDRGLAALVKPKNPPKIQRFRDADERRLATLVNDVADVEELVGEIESNRRNVPVLLRQYLKLNAKLLGFNIDPDFGDVLDGLVLVDLARIEPSLLNRYLGNDGAATFLRFHGIQSDASSS